MGIGGSFPVGKVAGAWSWPHLHLVPMLKNVCGAMPPLPHYHLMTWCSVKAQVNIAGLLRSVEIFEMCLGYLRHRSRYFVLYDFGVMILYRNTFYGMFLDSEAFFTGKATLGWSRVLRFLLRMRGGFSLPIVYFLKYRLWSVGSFDIGIGRDRVSLG
jgi:hypothetical protein